MELIGNVIAGIALAAVTINAIILIIVGCGVMAASLLAGRLSGFVCGAIIVAVYVLVLALYPNPQSILGLFTM